MRCSTKYRSKRSAINHRRTQGSFPRRRDNGICEHRRLPGFLYLWRLNRRRRPDMMALENMNLAFVCMNLRLPWRGLGCRGCRLKPRSSTYHYAGRMMDKTPPLLRMVGKGVEVKWANGIKQRSGGASPPHLGFRPSGRVKRRIRIL